MLYMFYYNCNNATFGYDFEQFANSLGAKKAYGRYKGKGPGMYFYLVPTKEVYTKLKEVAKAKYNIDMQKLQRYREEDYPDIKIIAEAINQKQESEFCWFGKYWDINKNKKFVYISKELTKDPDEADEIMQDMIPEPFTKFVFCGTIDKATADKEGYQLLESIKTDFANEFKLYENLF